MKVGLKILIGLVGVILSGFAGMGLAVYQNLRNNSKSPKYRRITGVFTFVNAMAAGFFAFKGIGIFLLSLLSFITTLIIMCCMCMEGNISENEW